MFTGNSRTRTRPQLQIKTHVPVVRNGSGLFVAVKRCQDALHGHGRLTHAMARPSASERFYGYSQAY